jgi:hypothetical protein
MNVAVATAFLDVVALLADVPEHGGRELQRPPQLLPSGWASVLYLYGLR